MAGISAGMDADQADRAMLRMELKTAVAADDFHVEYQPIIDLATTRITAIEALVRWNHPARGWISPSVFIPIAEESGLISDIGAMVLDRACRAAATGPVTAAVGERRPHLHSAIRIFCR